GSKLAHGFACAHLDTDDFYWEPTDPPFRVKRVAAERLRLLACEMDGKDGWVLSGSLDGWGDPLIPLFTAEVFLEVAVRVRLARLRAREQQRFGAAIDAVGYYHEDHLAFLDWAAAYDSGDMAMRSRQRHLAWLKGLPCPVIRLRGDRPLDELVEEVGREL